jgi:hypothetical protein
VHGKWDLIAAHEHRFCFQHKEREHSLEKMKIVKVPAHISVKGVLVVGKVIIILA